MRNELYTQLDEMPLDLIAQVYSDASWQLQGNRDVRANETLLNGIRGWAATQGYTVAFAGGAWVLVDVSAGVA